MVAGRPPAAASAGSAGRCPWVVAVRRCPWKQIACVQDGDNKLMQDMFATMLTYLLMHACMHAKLTS